MYDHAVVQYQRSLWFVSGQRLHQQGCWQRDFLFW